jgi:hypothetical protein
MFKSNDKKPRKRSLMKLQCAPNRCGTKDDEDEKDFYEVKNEHQIVSTKTVEDAPSHLIRKTMKYEQIQTRKSFDQVDNAGSTQTSRTFTLEYPSGRKVVTSHTQSKVKLEVIVGYRSL